MVLRSGLKEWDGVLGGRSRSTSSTRRGRAEGADCCDGDEDLLHEVIIGQRTEGLVVGAMGLYKLKVLDEINKAIRRGKSS